jgi:hypothetical protein
MSIAIPTAPTCSPDFKERILKFKCQKIELPVNRPNKRTDTMTKQKSIVVAVAGATLFAGSLARAQSFGYSADDLVVNFRNTASITASDLEVNLGPVSAIAALQSTKIVVPASLVQSVYGGSPSASTPIGFSATAADASGTTGTIWLTRADPTPGTDPTNYYSAQQVFSAQNLVAARIANIGAGADAGTILAQGQATVPGGTTGDSYQAQAEESSAQEAQSIINFAGDENIGPTKGSTIETIQNGGGAVYAALWEVPVAGTPDTYLGYFTFSASGEVDFTPASVVSQPPATLVIVPNGTNGVQVLWSATGTSTLQQNSNLAVTAGWTNSTYSVSTSKGTNSVTIAPATGNLFFRLSGQ